MSAHTPRPWKAICRDAREPDDSYMGWEIEGPPSDCLRGQFRLKADAVLAAAAPAMLQGLEDILLYAQDAIPYLEETAKGPRFPVVLAHLNSIIEEAGAAIAQARGET